MTQIAMTARITGRVQGVSFRAWTQARARKYGLQGWVRNDPYGSVSALFQGPPKAVQQMIEELWEGPAAANVRDVQTAETPLAEFEPLFQIRH